MIKTKQKQVYATYTDLKSIFKEEELKQFFSKPDVLVKKEGDIELWLYFAARVKNQILKNKIPVSIGSDFQYLHKRLLEIVKDTVEEASNGIYKEPKVKKIKPFYKDKSSTQAPNSKLQEQRLQAEQSLAKLSDNNKPLITLKRKVR